MLHDLSNNLSRYSLVFLLLLAFSALLTAGNLQDVISGVNSADTLDQAAKSATSAQPTQSEASAVQAKSDLSKLPIFFIPNKGQADGSVKYYASGAGYNFLLTQTGITYSFERANSVTAAEDDKENFALNISFTNANTNAAITAVDQQAGKVNYLIGNDESKWQTDVSTYGAVTYTGLYQGIDLTYTGDSSKIKYAYNVAPGANYNQIGMTYSGASALTTDKSGNLLIATPWGNLKDEAPIAYQMINGQRVPVDAAFAVTGMTVGFTIGAFNAAYPLVIDPGIEYSTFLGGSGSEQANDLTLDSEGNTYITGSTSSSNFPVTADEGSGMAGPLDKRANGAEDIFVSKFDTEGKLVFSTFLGGSATDVGKGIRINSAGEIIIAGECSSYNCPCPDTDTFDRFWNGGVNPYLVALDPAGNKINNATFLGKNLQVIGLEMGESDQPIILGTGGMAGGLVPVENGYDMGPEAAEHFVTKLESDLSDLVFSSVLRNATLKDFTIDIAENVYFTGYTTNASFDIHIQAAGSSFDSTCGPDGEIACTAGDELMPDAVVLKMNASGTSLAYASFIGGFGKDYAHSITVNDAGNAFIAGATDSCDFPDESILDDYWFDNCSNGLSDAFLIGLSSDGTNASYLQRFGGIGDDGGQESKQFVDLDSNGNPVVVGYTESDDFPITVGALDGNKSEGSEVYIARFDVSDPPLYCCSGLNSANLLYSTFFGWGFTPQIQSMLVDGSDDLYLTGGITGAGFPTSINAFDRSYNESQDAFFTKIDLVNSFLPTVNASVVNCLEGTNEWCKQQLDITGKIIVPRINLTSTGTGTTFYRWGESGSWIAYTSSFAVQEGDNSGTNALQFYGSNQDGSTGDVESLAVKYDPIAPNPAVIKSTTHTENVPSNNPVITFDLGANYLSNDIDTPSGVAYYNIEISQDDDCAKEVGETLISSTDIRFIDSDPIPNGSSRSFFAQAVDNAGNLGAVACIGPFVIDTQFDGSSSVTVTPDPNDGHYDWYKSIPTIELSGSPQESDLGQETFYRWDSSLDAVGDYLVETAEQEISMGGAPQNIRGDDLTMQVDLPFDFPFFGGDFASLYVSTNGLITFNEPNSSHLDSVGALGSMKAIAPLWDDFRTDGHASDDIYISSNDSEISIRWQSRNYSFDDAATNFEVILYADGRIRFNYGVQEGFLNATIGISNGSDQVTAVDGVTSTDLLDSTIYTLAQWETYDGSFKSLEGEHTLYFYSVDAAGNREGTTNSLSQKVDIEVPTDPQTFVSCPVDPGTPFSDANLSVDWAGASDDFSGIDGYSIEWSQTAPEDIDTQNHPDSTMDVQESVTTAEQAPSGDATWYFYIRTKDNAGHWSAGTSYGPFIVDDDAPAADCIKPDTVISSGPSGTIASRDVAFTWTGSDNITASGDLLFSFWLMGYELDYGAFGEETSASYTNLPNGDYTFKVRAMDEAGNVDDTVAEQTFTIEAKSINVSKGGTGNGLVTSASGDVNCGSDCYEVYTSDTTVTLTASPDANAYFAGWSGAGCSGTGDCVVLVDDEKSVTATFIRIPGIFRTESSNTTFITYSASCWNNYANVSLSSGEAKVAKTSLCNAQFTFDGSKIEWIGAKSNKLGKAKVYVDGVFQANIDQYAASTSAQQVLYTGTFLTPGIHTIKIEATNTKNSKATNTWVLIDAFDVTN